MAAGDVPDAGASPAPGASPAGASPAADRPTLARRVALAAALAAGAGAALYAIGGYFAPTRPRPVAPVRFGLIDGRRLDVASLHGQVVLVNFWATSCAVCVAEMPELVRLYLDLHGRGLEVVAVAMPYDRPDHVLDFVARRALPFPVALDPMGEAVRALGPVAGTPTTLLVDAQGLERRRWEGRPDFGRLRREIDGLLPQARSGSGQATPAA